jgi:hypothetical protein
VKNKFSVISVACLFLILTACISIPNPEEEAYHWADRVKAVENSDVLGFGILYRIPGQWNGPVTSDTPAGNFPVWYVDFRPVSPAQISQFSTVDPTMNNYVSFFIVRHGGRLKVAMRTDALFENEGCITYEVMREADENRGYYKFVDFQSGEARAYTIFEFSEHEMEMRVYTNKFNKLRDPELHSTWKAKRITMASAQEAIEHFDYPQPEMVKNFSSVFGNAHESVFFVTEEDPYPSGNEPYVGSITFNITIDEELATSPSDELFLMLTTEPIFQRFVYNPQRLNYISKFVYLSIDQRTYTLTHIHPGDYYLYSYNDINGDKMHKSGDFMSSKWEHIVTVPPNGNITVDTHIDYVIP